MSDIQNLKDWILCSIERDLGELLRSDDISIEDCIRPICGILGDLIYIDRQGNPIFKKTPDDWDELSGRHTPGGYGGGFNIIPSVNDPDPDTDTLVVLCLGGDNLEKRLDKMLLAVGNSKFRRVEYKKVIFITTKWDIREITDKNIKTLQYIYDYINTGVRFSFILLSTGGLSKIKV